MRDVLTFFETKQKMCLILLSDWREERAEHTSRCPLKFWRDSMKDSIGGKSPCFQRKRVFFDDSEELGK